MMFFLAFNKISYPINSRFIYPYTEARGNSIVY